MNRAFACLTAMGLLASAASGDKLIWDFTVDESQIRNGPEPDGSTNSTATGSGHIEYDTVTNVISYTISWNGLFADLTKLHIHGPADANASNPQHVLEIFGPPDIPPTVDLRSDSWTDAHQLLTLEQPGFDPITPSEIIEIMRNGQAYLNVHTTVFGMGEIRGNLGEPQVICTCADTLTWSFDATEDQVRNGPEPDGSTNSIATGSGLVIYDATLNELSYEYTWQNLFADLTKLHVHGPADENSSTPQHLHEVFGPPDPPGALDLRNDTWIDSQILTTLIQPNFDPIEPEEAIAIMTDGLAYLNVHTTVFGMGEIRGNLGVPVSSCSCDIDGTPGVGVGDLLAFLGDWFPGNPGADRDGSGVTNITDLLLFLQCWFSVNCA